MFLWSTHALRPVSSHVNSRLPRRCLLPCDAVPLFEAQKGASSSSTQSEKNPLGGKLVRYAPKVAMGDLSSMEQRPWLVQKRKHKSCYRKSHHGNEIDTDILHLNAAGTDIIVIGTYQAAVDLLEKKSSIYSGRYCYFSSDQHWMYLWSVIPRPRLPMVTELMGWDFNFGFMDYGMWN